MDQRVWLQQDLALLEVFASQAAMLVHQALLLNELQAGIVLERHPYLDIAERVGIGPMRDYLTLPSVVVWY